MLLLFTGPAMAQNTCDRWGAGSPGLAAGYGINLGVRLDTLKFEIESTKTEIRLFDQLPVDAITLKYFIGSLFVDTVRCDSAAPIVVGLTRGEVTQKTIALDTWSVQETDQLSRATGASVNSVQQNALFHLWSIKQAISVPAGGATDHVILRRDCLIDRSKTNLPTCGLVAERTEYIRSLLNPLPAPR